MWIMNIIYIMETVMALESQANPAAASWLARLWQKFGLFGEAIELSGTERLERRISALEAEAIIAFKRAD